MQETARFQIEKGKKERERVCGSGAGPKNGEQPVDKKLQGGVRATEWTMELAHITSVLTLLFPCYCCPDSATEIWIQRRKEDRNRRKREGRWRRGRERERAALDGVPAKEPWREQPGGNLFFSSSSKKN